MLALPLWYADSCETQKLDPLPCIVYCRGGNRDFGMLEPWEVCWYAYHGYAVFGSQYRGNAGGTGREDFGGNDVHDVTNLIDIAVHMPFVKSDQVYLWGISRGGMMAYRAIQEKPGRIRAAVINSGMADCYVSYNRDKSMAQVYIDLVGGGPDKYPKEFDRRSATKFAADLNVPMFIGQGTDDWRVVPLQVENLEKALKAAGKKAGTDYTIKWYEGGTHCLYETSFESDAMSWLDKYPIN
jgi:dipeptidyl aminopeptidase/acylaminoacyl peptidase